MATLVRNNKTGEVFSVSDEQVGDVITQGDFSVSDQTRVPILQADGTVAHVVGDAEMRAAIEKGGRVARAEEVQAVQDEEQYGGALETTKAFGEGVARGLTFGLSDPALIAAGISDPEALRKREEVNPYAAGTGEALGILAPVIATGGESIVGQALSKATPAGLTAAAGRAVERAGARSIGETLFGRAAVRGAAGAVEGASMLGTQELARQLEEDSELSGERIYQAALEGAGIGAMAAGTLSVGADATIGLARSIKNKVVEKLPELVSREGIEQGLKAKLVQDTAGTLDRNLLKRTVVESQESVPEIVSAAENEIRTLGVVDDTFSQKSSAQLLQETSQKADEALKTVNQEVADVRRAIDSHLDEIPDMKVIRGRLQKEVLDDFENSPIPSFQGKAAALHQELDQFLDPTNQLTFEALGEFSDKLSNAAYVGGMSKDGSILVKPLKDLQPAANIVAEELNRQTRDLLEGDALAEYKALQTRKATLSLLRDSSTKEMQRIGTFEGDTGINLVGAIDSALGATNQQFTSIAAGAALGIVGGYNPIHGAIAGLALGTVGAFLRPIVEKQVAKAARIGTNKLLTLAERSAAQTSSLNTAVKRFVNSAGRKTRQTAVFLSSKSLADKYMKARDAVPALAQQPQTDKFISQTITQEAAQHAPMLANSMTATHQRASQYLLQNLPPQRPARGIDRFAGGGEDQVLPLPSQKDMRKFVRRVQVVENPASVVKRLTNGERVHHEEAEAFRTVYPASFSHLQQTFSAALAENKKARRSLSRDQKIRLSMFFGIPIHFSMDPAYISYQQNRFAQLKEERSKPPPNGRVANFAEDMETPLDTLG